MQMSITNLYIPCSYFVSVCIYDTHKVVSTLLYITQTSKMFRAQRQFVYYLYVFVVDLILPINWLDPQNQ